MIINCGSHELDLSAPVVMGVLNVTPDSFSDGGKYLDAQSAVDHAREMIDQGARIIDIGGESTRPGAVPVSVEEELRRTLPVIEQVSKLADVVVSIDTSKPEVMREAVSGGAGIINDIRALTDPEALKTAASTGAAVCVMHMQGQPDNMQVAPQYQNVVAEVHRYLAERIAACAQAGIARDKIIIDPGIGFGKTVQHNLELLSRLPAFNDLSCPLLIGVSRKSMIGRLLDRPVEKRVSGGVALATAAVLAGAKIIRAHDVAETVDAVRVAYALLQQGYGALI
jgi:dihydropteroate synthase